MQRQEKVDEREKAAGRGVRDPRARVLCLIIFLCTCKLAADEDLLSIIVLNPLASSVPFVATCLFRKCVKNLFVSFNLSRWNDMLRTSRTLCPKNISSVLSIFK